VLRTIIDRVAWANLFARGLERTLCVEHSRPGVLPIANTTPTSPAYERVLEQRQSVSVAASLARRNYSD